MNLIKQLTTQLSSLWNSWSKTQRTGIVGVACACVVGIIVVGFWASSKDFVTLTNSLTPGQAHNVVSALQAEGIEYELNFAGSAVSVPVNDVSRARIALKELGHDEADDVAESTAGWWPDPGQQRSQQQRALERRLGATISQMRSVRSATVHITQAESSPFIRQQTPAKASVILQLASREMFSGSDAQAIVSLVSHAVENLDAENTMIVDTDGHVLSSSEGVGADVSGQLQYRQKLENNLSSKAESMLVPLLGHGRAIVRVTADIDFTEKNTARTTYDPDAKVKTKEKIETETSRGGGQLSGVSGAASNVGSLSTDGADGNESDKETIETEYQNTEIVDTIREAPGRVNRLTVAAVVELPHPKEPEEGETAAAPASVVTAEQVEKIIMQAVGFDAARNDEIEVLAAPLQGVPDFAAPVGWLGSVQELLPLVRSASLGIAAIIALILGTIVMKRLKPVVVEVERRESISPEFRARLADISDEMKEHPEAVSTVLTGWLSEQQRESSSKPAARRAA